MDEEGEQKKGWRRGRRRSRRRRKVPAVLNNLEPFAWFTVLTPNTLNHMYLSRYVFCAILILCIYCQLTVTSLSSWRVLLVGITYIQCILSLYFRCLCYVKF
jgi:hypothetical protein